MSLKFREGALFSRLWNYFKNKIFLNTKIEDLNLASFLSFNLFLNFSGTEPIWSDSMKFLFYVYVCVCMCENSLF